MPANLEVTMAWRRRVLIFDGQPLAEVVREINRYRPGKIILANDDLGVRKVQARFSLNQLADVAALIQDAYGAKVTLLPGGIVILS
jgi:transmembrane sensor